MDMVGFHMKALANTTASNTEVIRQCATVIRGNSENAMLHDHNDPRLQEKLRVMHFMSEVILSRLGMVQDKGD